jgi:hypothetical protein
MDLAATAAAAAAAATAAAAAAAAAAAIYLKVYHAHSPKSIVVVWILDACSYLPLGTW